jgi:Rrf2 family protein
MKLLTKNTDYAVRAVIHLAGHDNGYVSSTEIALAEKIPLHFLRRILQTLKRRGIVESKEGATGGVRLGVKPGRIRISDIMKIFQGEIELSACVFRKKPCENRKTCVLRKRIKEIEGIVRKEFDRVTIAELLEDKDR